MRHLPISLQIRNLKRWMKKVGYDSDEIENKEIFENIDPTLSYSENFEIIKEAIERMGIQKPYKIEMEEYIEEERLSEEDLEDEEKDVYPQILP